MTRNRKSPPVRRLTTGRVRRCPKCGEATRSLTRHLAEVHAVPVVMIGQGDFRQEWPKRH